MILCSGVNGRADQRDGEFAARMDVVRAAADLEAALIAAVDRADMDVRIRNQFARLDKADHNAGNILSDLDQLLHLKSGGEQTALQLSGVDIDIDIIPQPA